MWILTISMLGLQLAFTAQQFLRCQCGPPSNRWQAVPSQALPAFQSQDHLTWTSVAFLMSKSKLNPLLHVFSWCKTKLNLGIFPSVVSGAAVAVSGFKCPSDYSGGKRRKNPALPPPRASEHYTKENCTYQNKPTAATACQQHMNIQAFTVPEIFYYFAVMRFRHAHFTIWRFSD